MIFATFVIVVFSMCFCLVELMMELVLCLNVTLATVLSCYCEFLAVLSKCPENNKGHAEIF
jgi:hypothetical protein